MNQHFEYLPDQLIPDRQNVYRSMGLKDTHRVSAEVEKLYYQALDMFLKLAQPKGLIQQIQKEKFRDIFLTNVISASESPLVQVVDKADRLALTVFTLGGRLSDKIKNLFCQNDPALGAMLDAISSSGAELSVKRIEDGFQALTHDQKCRTLMYSPGYCGWPIDAQKELFAILTHTIGVHLTNRLLMVPTKSISGILVAGDYKIHCFLNTFVCCKDCRYYSCIERRNILCEHYRRKDGVPG